MPFDNNPANMQFFPDNHASWHRCHKEVFFLFIRVLLKYLKLTKKTSLRQEVKQAISDCRDSFLNQRAALPGSFPPCIAATLFERLREVVPADTWAQTEVYLHRYLMVVRRNRQSVQPVPTNKNIAVIEDE